MANLLTHRHLRVALGLLVATALIAPAVAVVAPAATLQPSAVQPPTTGQLDPGPVATAVSGADFPAELPDAAPLATAQAAPPNAGPSTEYLEAMAHAAERPAFTPGGPATTPLEATRSAATASRSAALTSSTTRSTTAGLRREVLGFLPYWTLGSRDLRLDYTTLSTIAYFAVTAGPDGHLQTRDPDGTPSVGWAGWTSRAMTAVIDAAHRHGTRVALTIERFAWTSGQAADTTTLLSSSILRARLAAEIAKAVHDRGADGVNLDFEPIPAGQTANYVAFVRQLRADLSARRAGYELTFDATGRPDGYDVTGLTAPGAADAVMIMGYDYRGAGSPTAGSIDPLTGPTYDLTDTVDAYLASTTPGKIILGRARTTAAPGAPAAAARNAPTLAPSSHNGYSVSATYAQAVALAAAHGRHYDGLEQSAWTAYAMAPCSGCSKVTRELYYDDAASLGQRYDMINRKGLRGAGIWALGYDGTRPELAAELRAKFINDTTAPVVGLVALPATTGDLGFTVAWRGSDDRSGLAWFDVQVSIDGGAWKAWLTHVTVTSAMYQGVQGHGYAFRVRAADGRGNVSPFNVGSVYTPTPTLRAGGLRPGRGRRCQRAGGSGHGGGGRPPGPCRDRRGDRGRARHHRRPALVRGGPAGDHVGAHGRPAGRRVDRRGGRLDDVSRPHPGPQRDAGGRPHHRLLVRRRRRGEPGTGRGPAPFLQPQRRRPRRHAAGRLDGHGGAGGHDPQRLPRRRQLRRHRADRGPPGRGPVVRLERPGGLDPAGERHVCPAAGRSRRRAACTTAPTTTAVGPVQLSLYGVTLHHVGTERLAGTDRYGTAAAISAAFARPGVPVVVIASGAGFADGLGAAPAAAALHAPLLLVEPGAIPAATAAELARLHPGRLVIVGGTASVAASVAQGLAKYTSGGVTRISGADRFATAAAVSAAFFKAGVPVAYVADGLSFADGVAAAAAAAHMRTDHCC